jgi:lysozyme family protein
VNNPADPGGPTNFAITITDYLRYTKPGVTAANVRRMTRGQGDLQGQILACARV